LESAAYSAICEHLQEPHNAGSRPQARFFNTLLIQSARLSLNDSKAKKGILFNRSVNIIPQCAGKHYGHAVKNFSSEITFNYEMR
jgi:hypothetical protein